MSSPFAEQPPRNRLTIAHLMLWTLGTAISLAFYRALSSDGQFPSDRFKAASLMFGLVYSLPAGARIGGLIWFAARRMHNKHDVPSQPGHWLLIVEGLSTILAFGGQAIGALIFGSQRMDIAEWSMSQIPNCFVTAIAYGVAVSYSEHETRLWNSTLWLLLIQHAIAILTYSIVVIQALLGIENLVNSPALGYVLLFGWQASCCSLLFGILVPIAAVQDPLRGDRDFLHWTGVACVIATALIQILAPFVFQMLI